MTEGLAAGAFGRFVRVTPMTGEAVGTPFLIEKDGERRCVHRLDGYEAWTVLAAGNEVRPIENAEWDGARWRYPIAFLKAAKWVQIKGIREAKRFTEGCATPKGKIDCDAAARASLRDAHAAAQIEGATYADVWTMFDNSSVPVVAADIANMVAAVGRMDREVMATARELRAQIDAAVTRPQIAAVAWPSVPQPPLP